MPHTKPNKATHKSRTRKHIPGVSFVLGKIGRFWRRGFWSKLACLVLAFLFLVISSMYGIARWYIAEHADEPLKLGVTFISQYARYYELDPQETMQAIIDDLHVKSFRLVSYWDEIEKTPGQYDFSELDWQFAKAQTAGAEVSLAIGLRQPRWPECHMPEWAMHMPKRDWYPYLKDFIGKVIERYKDNPALSSYQLENEFFMTVFGICPDFSRDRLIDEFNYVKSLDKDTPIIISRSNNWIGLPVNEPRPDKFGISVYKRVWDKTFTKRYFEYPLPAWFYSFLAGAGELVTGKDMMIHELQAESWLPDGFDMRTASLEEQNKSMNAKRLHDRFEYGKATGMREIDAWGVEWWYWRKIHFHDSSLWDVAKDEFTNSK